MWEHPFLHLLVLHSVWMQSRMWSHACDISFCKLFFLPALYTKGSEDAPCCLVLFASLLSLLFLCLFFRCSACTFPVCDLVVWMFLSYCFCMHSLTLTAFQNTCLQFFLDLFLWCLHFVNSYFLDMFLHIPWMPLSLMSWVIPGFIPCLLSSIFTLFYIILHLYL